MSNRVDFTQYPDEVSEGSEAFYKGEGLFDNPYSYTDPKRAAWIYGYEQEKEKE